MSTPSPSLGHSPVSPQPTVTGPSRRDRWMAVIPLLSLLALIGIMWAGAAWADSFPTEDVTWGFVFGAFVLTVFYAPLPLLTTLVTGLTGVLAKQPSTVRNAAKGGAVVAGLCGLAAVFVGVVTAASDDTGNLVFGLSLVVGGLLPVAALLLFRLAGRR